MEMQERLPVKLLHFGDVFLDCPFAELPPHKSQERRKETRNTLLRAVKYVSEQEIKLVLITGNLLDNRYATLDTLQFLKNAFSMAPNCQFVICPGPYDYMGENSLYQVGKFPSNVTIFDKSTPTVKEFDNLGVSVVGWAYTSRVYEGSPIENMRPDTKIDHMTIVAGYANESITKIGAFGGDYAAFSGSSLFSGFHRVNTTTYAYCGALEHSTFAEAGFGGANMVTLYPPSVAGGVIAETARVDFGSRRYAMEYFDVTGVSGPSDVVNRISETVQEKGYGEETALKVILVGTTPLGFSIPKAITAESLGLYVFELEDRTLPSFDESVVARDMTVRGEVCRTLIPKMRQGTEEEQRNAAQAMKVALAALQGKDISNI